MQTDSAIYEFVLDNLFFSKIDSPEIQKGKVNVTLTVKRIAGFYELHFQIDGMVIVSCDRCLEEMEQTITSTELLKVKFGKDYSQEGDNIIVIPEVDGSINVSWYMFEFIVLCLPMKHVHAPGKCNKMMTSKLNKHMKADLDDENSDDSFMADTEEELPTSVGEEGLVETDPRWDELKKILDNN